MRQKKPEVHFSVDCQSFRETIFALPSHRRHACLLLPSLIDVSTLGGIEDSHYDNSDYIIGGTDAASRILA